MVPIDPVCGMEVKEDVPYRSEYEGRTYYFCCRGCKVAFDREPGRYAGREEDRTRAPGH